MRALLLATAASTTLASGAPAATLREALVSTYNTSPALAAARAQLRATDEGVPIAKAGARLQVSGTAGVTQTTDGVTRLFNGARVLTGGVNLSYPLFQGGRVRNAIQGAEARVIAGRADLRTSEGNLFTNAVAAYMDVIRDTAIVGLNANQVRVLDTNLRASRDRFQVGDLTRTDVAQSQARLARARSQLATAEGQLTTSRENYRRLIGVWPEGLETPPPLPTLPGTADQAVQVSLGNSPSIAAATAASQAAGYDVRVERAARLPTLSATSGASYNNYLGTAARSIGLPSNTPGVDNSQSESRIGVALTVPLYQGGLVGSRVRQAQAFENQALEQAIDVERQVIANTRSAFAAYGAAGETIRASEEAVRANTLALEGVRAENGVGTRTVLDVLDAEQELLNSRVALVTAERDRYVAGFALLNAMGRAEARDLNFDGGALYDPVLNYRRVRGRVSDWGDDPRPAPKGTHTTGATPAGTAPDVPPVDDEGADLAPLPADADPSPALP